MDESKIRVAYTRLIYTIGDELVKSAPSSLFNPSLGEARQVVQAGEYFLGLVIRGFLGEPKSIHQRRKLRDFLAIPENVIKLKERIWTSDRGGFYFLVPALEKFLEANSEV